MGRLLALAVLSPDALSSVAYGPEAMMAILVLAGAAELKLSLPIGAALAVLMLSVASATARSSELIRTAVALTSLRATAWGGSGACSRERG